MSKLEDESTVWDERVIGDVHVRFGYVDKKEYRARLLQERETSQVIMQPFIVWFQRVMKGKELTARNYGALVWRVLRETENQPMHYIGDTTKSYHGRKTARTAMRNFCTFLVQDEGTSEEDKRWAKDTLQALALPLPKSLDLASTETSKPVKEKSRRIMQARPLYPEEYEALIKAWRAYSLKGTLPIQRYVAGMITLAAGLTWNETCLITREDIEHLEKTGKLRITAWRNSKNRIIPIKGLKKELRILLEIPMTWDTIADLLAPTKPVSERLTHAATRLRMTVILKAATPLGIPTSSFTTRVRTFLAYSAWLRGEPILAQQYLAYGSTAKVNATISAMIAGTISEEEWDQTRYVTEDA